MTDKERIDKAFSCLHASPDAVTEAMKMANNTENNNEKKSFRRMRTASIAVGLCLALSVTAFAAVMHSDFFKDAFGTGVKSVDEQTYEKFDEDGNVISTYTYPSMERVDVDDESASKLLGEYIDSLDQRLAIDDWSWDIGEYVFDSNGIGIVAVRLSNPNGIEAWNKARQDHSQPPIGSVLVSASGEFPSNREYVIEDSVTETGVDIIYYITPTSEIKSGESIEFGGMVYKFDEDGEASDIDEGSVTIPSQNKVDCTELHDEKAEVSVSPIGMALTYKDGMDTASRSENSIVIDYKDGTSYVVISDADNINNESCASIDGQGHLWIAFNRLVDPEEIERITVGGTSIGDDGEAESFAYVLK